ncbi:MAG: integrin alpha, partial [Chloroherpetonaceae bacterium]|nr:integrin alpha [Chloroherpetonaceae bacterium]
MKQIFLLTTLAWAMGASAQINPDAKTPLPDGVPASWWETVQKNIRESEYHIRPKGDGMFSSPNRAQNLRFTYFERGFSATRRDSLAHLWKAELRYIGISKGRAVQRDGARFQLSADANALMATSEGLLMRYRNDEKGMRQDFIVKKKPAGKGALRLWLEAMMSGGKVEVKPDAVSFLSEGGAEAMRYSDLKVWDANQRRLESRFEREGERLAIVVNDKNAAYPITIDPLSATPNWTAESNQANAFFGYSVASAGDVNGDGFSDVIVGAYLFDNGQTDEGRAFVYHGSASGLSATANWTAESNQTGAEFGYSAASAGDVNGDGFSDVIVGARYFDNGQTDEGAAFVYHGSASGLSTTPNRTVESNQANAWFGISVASAGDVNGDGFSDVIAGVAGFDSLATNAGAAFVYHGSASGLSATANWTAVSNQAGAFFGDAVASAGDVNGDGFSDVIVGAYFFDSPQTNAGAAFVYHGSASGLSATANWTAVSNQAGAFFGDAVASAGDVNGDGFSDVIVGASFFDNGHDDEGRAFVYHGSASGLSATANWTAESNQAFARFGISVASAGDVNGDGYSDVIVGAWRFTNGETNEGRAFVYHGSASGLSTTPNWTAESNQTGAEFGYSAASAGDVNGDGFSDVIVGAYLFDNGETDEGRAFVYHGSASGLSATANWTAESNQTDAQFGASVASAGDVNGDGFSDVIVGARLFDNGETDEGMAFVYHGSASGLSATPNWTAESNQAFARFGISVASAGDVNGDGFSDVIVGAYFFDNGQGDEGRAFVYHGSASGLSATANWTAESNQTGAEFGYSVASAGDVNGDGFSDVIVGTPYYDNSQTDEGMAFVYHGSASGLSATANWTAASNQANTYFGFSVASAGDVNGDGFSDVIVGALSFDNGETDEGRAFVYHGSASGLSTTPNWTAESNQAHAGFGWSVASAGDVNGDGFSDVIVGAWLFDNGETNEGRAFVYHGSASGLSATANWTAESNQANTYFGDAVASAGDVNGDGYGDVIVGAPYYDNFHIDEGAAFVYHGSASGLSATPNWMAESNDAGAWFGASVASAGDVNGDGFSDVIVGAP